jgi:acyl-[acyl carrier protein]--UDP-N-acetylglucosamine O-acyltransferase
MKNSRVLRVYSKGIIGWRAQERYYVGPVSTVLWGQRCIVRELTGPKDRGFLGNELIRIGGWQYVRSF